MPPAADDTSKDSPAGPEQEVDMWWGSYSIRALFPGLVLCGLLTVIIGVAAGYAWRVAFIPADAVRYTAYGLVALLWAVQLCRSAYLVLTKTYRLTNFRLYLEKTFRRSPFRRIDLAQITDVRVEQSSLERRLGIGRIRIWGEGLRKPISLQGIYQPGTLAIELRRLAKETREKTASKNAS
jgi:hypothetical protein